MQKRIELPNKMAQTMAISTLSTDNSYENTKGIYTGLTLIDNHVYSTLNISEATKAAKSKHNFAVYKIATVCLGLLCAFFVIAIVALCVYLEAPKQCPQGFVLYTSRCYYFSSSEKNWTASRKACKEQGADLVVIETEEEQVFIHSFFRSDHYWIGLTDSSKEGTWLWVDGSQQNVWYWRDGEPNSYDGRNEDCVQGFRGLDALKNWNDVGCQESCRWVCEANPQ